MYNDLQIDLEGLHAPQGPQDPGEYLSPPNQPSETARHLRLQGVPLTALEFSGIFSFLVSSSTSDSHSDAVELSMTAPTPLGGSPRLRPSPDHQGSSPNPSNHPIFSSKDCGLPPFPPLTTKVFDELCCPSRLPGGPAALACCTPCSGSWAVSS